jgi:hypothetical protein
VERQNLNKSHDEIGADYIRKSTERVVCEQGATEDTWNQRMEMNVAVIKHRAKNTYVVGQLMLHTLTSALY